MNLFRISSFVFRILKPYVVLEKLYGTTSVVSTISESIKECQKNRLDSLFEKKRICKKNGDIS